MGVENSETNREKCACPGCPSFGACMSAADEALYCAVGKPSCPVDKLGCVCGACVVHRQNDLASVYYCIEGAAE